jgi:hypothetical protein
MKTEIIDRTTGGSAEEFKIGTKGYFWDRETGIHTGVLTSISKDRSYPYEKSHANNWLNFSPTIPEWFPKWHLPSEAKVETKPIELVKFIKPDGQTRTPTKGASEFETVERIHKDVEGFDLIKCTTGPLVNWYLGHWNDGCI